MARSAARTGARNGSSQAPASGSAPSQASADASSRRRRFSLWCLPKKGPGRRTFQCTFANLADCALMACTTFVEKIVYILGPILICFALAILSGLGYTFFTIILPMMHRYYEQKYPHEVLPGSVGQVDADNGQGGLSSFLSSMFLGLQQLLSPSSGSSTGSSAGSDSSLLGNAIDSAPANTHATLIPNIFAENATTGDWIIMGHILIVCYFLTNIAFNYFMCVMTSNGGTKYEKVVRELAHTQGVYFPQSPDEETEFRLDVEHKLRIRFQRRHEKANPGAVQRQRRQHLQQARTNAILQRNTQLAKQINSTLQSKMPISAAAVQDAARMADDVELGGAPQRGTAEAGVVQGNVVQGGVAQRRVANSKAKPQRQPQPQQVQATPKQIRSWMILAPDEWSWCNRSKQPKPPRSHYDHVSQSLILNLDHYCPWMFNAIGYFNYRYFCTFLWLVHTGMMYGVCITYVPFVNTSGPLYRSQVDQFRRTGHWERMHADSMVPFPREKMPISLAFMICLAVGIAVAFLGGFHLYLTLTAQTTIEFHGNWMSARKARKAKRKWINPYSLGARRNWQQVFGSRLNPFLAVLLPSTRQPEYLPLPIAGEQGKRPEFRLSASKMHSVEDHIV